MFRLFRPKPGATQKKCWMQMQNVDFFSPDLQLHSAFPILDSGLHLHLTFETRHPAGYTASKLYIWENRQFRGATSGFVISNVGQNLDQNICIQHFQWWTFPNFGPIRWWLGWVATGPTDFWVTDWAHRFPVSPISVQNPSKNKELQKNRPPQPFLMGFWTC